MAPEVIRPVVGIRWVGDDAKVFGDLFGGLGGNRDPLDFKIDTARLHRGVGMKMDIVKCNGGVDGCGVGYKKKCCEEYNEDKGLPQWGDSMW